MSVPNRLCTRCEGWGVRGGGRGGEGGVGGEKMQLLSSLFLKSCYVTLGMHDST